MNPPRVVADRPASTIQSSRSWSYSTACTSGTPHALLDRVRDGTVTLVSSPVLLAKLAEVFEQPRFGGILARPNTSPASSLAEVQALAEVLVAEPLPQPVCPDPDDYHVLALALTTQVDLIFSGDKYLLDLNTFQTSRSSLWPMHCAGSRFRSSTPASITEP